MHYLNLMGCRLKYFVIFVVGLCACNGSTSKVEQRHILNRSQKMMNFDEYFQKMQSKAFNEDHVFILEINQTLGFCNSTNNAHEVEIRVVSHKIFDETFYYRLIRSGEKWIGRKYTVQGVTSQVLKEESYVPKIGWQNFEMLIMENDILTLEDSEGNEDIIDPRYYSIQIVTPSFMKIISLKNFYDLKYDAHRNLRTKKVLDALLSR